MALLNADKQERHCERLQNQGLVHVQGWVSPEQAELIKQIIAGASEASEGANEIIDGIKNIKERWETVLEKYRVLSMGGFRNRDGASVSSSGRRSPKPSTRTSYTESEIRKMMNEED
jgi:hypothetical protein